MKKIILLGYMGSGKSTTAKTLGKALLLPTYDLDQLIEAECQSSISNIFLERGEIFFRKKEQEIFQKLLQAPESFVLSLGGGTPCYANNHLLLNQEQLVSVYLKASIPTLLSRLANDSNNRPILAQNTEEPLESFIAKQLFERSYFYHHAQHTIKVDQKDVATITEEIISLLA
ncbi:shikimate kinase [Flavobacterium sp. NKUCC04_CG]|uniref:shikimate kinase n=1 Tax=Flavobacterium sp. NKUCC04_CG TaxID=2842121 RepID=UPI001C5B63B9|nr:shikimate kinase [Flavobacterium sp. NKUCC04_CG]MBW3519598.1 AAA family ATPase [Flavobacterium sp. NKUCC04_CG]